MNKLFVLGLLIALASAVYALPTYFGPTGGVYTQNATIQQGVALSVTDNLSGSGMNIPLTQLTFGVTPTLEVGALYMKPEESAWGAYAKYVLPFTIAKGKLAAGLTYEDYDGDTAWAGALSGTFPVFADSQFTAEVLFMRADEDDQTSYLFNLEKPFKNGTALGLEYGFNMFEGGDAGTAYITLPINEMLSGRVALTGIGQDTSMLATISAKF